MPANKEALVRYRAINRCLIERRISTKDDLIEACTEAVGAHVSWRTIAGDIKAMRYDEQLGYLAPIKNIKNEGYVYTDKNYSIDSIPLQKEELMAISFAAKLLKQYSQIELFSTFSGAVEKLSEKVDLHIKENDTTALGNVIGFEKSATDGGSGYINEFLQHIRQQTVLDIEYHSFSSNSTKTHIVHPYFLKEYRNRWYVVGYHESYKEIRTLALERILNLTPNYSETYRPSDLDINSYYQHAVGVSVTKDEPIEIEFKLSEREYQYLETQPIHRSQTCISKSSGWVIVGLTAILNYELKTTLLSMGSSIEVIKPSHLRDFLKTEAERIVEYYSQGD
ncbi:MAG: WYL domain-containing protein [Bacteroidia bacterium]|nr:WYL domain-containing protein [Bacteroidia bacterium]